MPELLSFLLRIRETSTDTHKGEETFFIDGPIPRNVENCIRCDCNRFKWNPCMPPFTMEVERGICGVFDTPPAAFCKAGPPLHTL